MLSEICNALLLTYLATEYWLLTNHHYYDNNNNNNKQIVSQRNVVLFLIVGLVNLLDHLSGLALYANEMLQGVLHLPRVVLAAFAYLVALYIDCRRVYLSLQFRRDFVPTVMSAFCYILPVYPLLAVIISFGFMLIINLFEFFHWPLELLNAPIYYGTLYGPFSMVYLRVKRTMVDRQNSLPS